MKALTSEHFLKDVAGHKMTVILDRETHRHLIFRKPGESNLWFEVVTWPGSITIHGDMGTWTFARVRDMFSFFRSSEGLRINASYWSEKVTAQSIFGGPTRQFDIDTFKSEVIDSLDGYDLNDERKADIIEALKQDVFCEDDESTARRALADFRLDDGKRKFTFSDPWEIDGKVYSYHFLWCLHAIVWGIQQYDAAHAEVTAVPVPA